MDSNNTLKQLLDTLFQNKNLKSYTIHDKSGLTNVTLRFGDCDNISNSVSERVTYKKKSSKQMKRDSLRQERFHGRFTQSQVELQSAISVEGARLDLEENPFSETGLSPEAVHVSSSTSTPPCLSDSSASCEMHSHVVHLPEPECCSRGIQGLLGDLNLRTLGVL